MELKKFEIEVHNIFMTEHYDIDDAETVEELQKCKPIKDLLNVLSEKFKPQYSETIIILQYCKLVRNIKEKPVEQMGCLRMKTTECN